MGAVSSKRGGAEAPPLPSLAQTARERRSHWPLLLGATQLRTHYGCRYYRALVSVPKTMLSGPAQEDMRQMEIDVPRLCPHEPLRERYRRVVSAFTLHSLQPGGYVPSVGMLAAALLDALHDE